MGVVGESPFAALPFPFPFAPTLERVEVDDKLSGREWDHTLPEPLVRPLVPLVLLLLVPVVVLGVMADRFFPCVTACHGDMDASARAAGGCFFVRRLGRDNGKTVLAYRAMDGKSGKASGIGRTICWLDFEELELVRPGAGVAAMASKLASLFSQRIRFSVQCLAITERPGKASVTISNNGWVKSLIKLT